mgnify:CR=1 FL=1
MDNPYMMNPSRDEDNDDIREDMLRCGDMVVGMAYVPMQMWDNVYDMCEALSRGTQFADLDKPFFGEDVWR